MEAAVALALGIALVATIAGVAMLRRRGAEPGGPPDDATDRAAAGAHGPGDPNGARGPRLLAPTRIVVVGGPRASTGLLPTAGQALAPLASPRRRLLRDASAALFAIALVALVASVMTSGASPAGGVLSATARPEAADAPAATPARTVSTSGSPTSPPHPAPTTAPAAVPASTPAASAVPAAQASATVAPARSSRPAASSAAAASRAPASTAPSVSRLALLAACPGRPGCYLYVVRFGDTLYRIADFFGIAPATILRLNPGITDPSVVVRGSTLVLPTPTR